MYVSGLGWLPVEATPSRRSGISAPAQASAIGPAIPEQSPEQTDDGTTSASAVTGAAATNTSGPAASGNTTETAVSGDAAEATEGGMLWPFGGGAGATGRRAEDIAMSIAIWAAMVALPLILAARIVRRRRLAGRKRRFGDKDRSRAVIAVYDYVEKICLFAERSGIGDGEMIGARTGGQRVALPDELNDIVMKARFSRHEPSKEELGKLVAYADKLSKDMSEGTPFFKRTLGKYIHGLF
jgi:hypothetical protein